MANRRQRRFEVTVPPIRSPGTAEPPDEEFDFPTTDATVEAGKLIVSETGLVAPGSSAAKLLPNVIAKLNSYPHFECHLPDDGDEWTNVGGSSNVVYVRLEQPIDGPLCETLLEIGCTSAAGDTVKSLAFLHTFDRFKSLALSRVDEVKLAYYVPGNTAIYLWDNLNLHDDWKTLLR